MDIIQIADQIEQRIQQLDTGRKVVTQRAEDKAHAVAEYEKNLAVTILRIRAGQISEFEDVEITGKESANLVEKIARGICWQDKLAADKTEALYKSAISNMEAIKAILNGLQSLNRHLSER